MSAAALRKAASRKAGTDPRALAQLRRQALYERRKRELEALERARPTLPRGLYWSPDFGPMATAEAP